MSDNLKKILKIAGGTVAGIVVFILLLFAAATLIFTQKNITRWTNRYANDYLNAKVKIDTVSFSVWSRFPHVTLRMTGGSILSNALEGEPDSIRNQIPAAADSLLSFRRLDVTLNLFKLLSSEIDLRRIRLETPRIYAYVSPSGKTNWDIYSITPEDTLSATGAADSSASGAVPFTFSLHRLNISRKGRIVYDSRPDGMAASVCLDRLMLRGDISSDPDRFRLARASLRELELAVRQSGTDARFAVDSLEINNRHKGFVRMDLFTHTSLRRDTLLLCDRMPLSINGLIRPDTLSRGVFTLESLKIKAAGVPAELNGTLRFHPDSIYTNLSGEIGMFEVSDLLRYIPRQLVPAIDSIRTDARLLLKIQTDGFYYPSRNKFPAFSLQCSVPDSRVDFIGKKSKIRNLETDLRIRYNPAFRDSLTLRIRKFILNGRGIRLRTSGTVSRLLADPHIDLDIRGNASLDTLDALFPSRNGARFKGDLQADLQLKSRLSDLQLYRIGQAEIKGSIGTDTLQIEDGARDFHFLTLGSQFKFGATDNTLDSSIQQGMRMLGISFTIDSASLRYQNELTVKGAGLALKGHQAADLLNGDTTSVHPFNGVLEAVRLTITGPDSSTIRLRNSRNAFGILPYQNDYKIPLLKLRSVAGLLSVRSRENRFSLTDGEVAIQAVMNGVRDNQLRQLRRNRMLDSLQTIYPEIPRDSLFGYYRTLRSAEREKISGKNGRRNIQPDDFSAEDPDIKVDRSIAEALRKWEVNGSATARRGRLITPYFPLRNRLENVDISFTTDRIDLKNTRIVSGSSRMTFTGSVSGMKRAMMLGRGKIRMNLDMDSDTLDMNELIRAANAGINYLNAGQSFKDSLMAEDNDEKLHEMIALDTAATDTTEKLNLIVIPSNLEADLRMNIRSGRYAGLTLSELSGQLIARDRCLQINDLKARTDAGDAILNAFYATRSKRDLSTGFDLELKDIEVEEIVQIIPGADTLLPILQSLEGKLNCQLAATARLDTSMNILLPTLKGVARLKGENLVLLDGETFTEIARKLKFKNRERNLIDKMSVEILIKDNTIEIFPFIIQMDRYQAAVSGVQHLDMSFDYHISVLRSPIPIRLGINVYGNMDDFHFRIGRAKYKNTNLPVYSQVIDSTRLNLRNHIRQVFRQGVDAALRNGGSLEAVEKFKQKHQDIGEMETLSEEELQQLEAIEPNTERREKSVPSGRKAK